MAGGNNADKAIHTADNITNAVYCRRHFFIVIRETLRRRGEITGRSCTVNSCVFAVGVDGIIMRAVAADKRGAAIEHIATE